MLHPHDPIGADARVDAGLFTTSDNDVAVAKAKRDTWIAITAIVLTLALLYELR